MCDTATPYWGGRVSLEGSIQSLSETSEAHRARADLAERKLQACRDLVDGWMRDFGPDTSAWRLHSPQTVSLPFAQRKIHAAIDQTR